MKKLIPFLAVGLLVAGASSAARFGNKKRIKRTLNTLYKPSLSINKPSLNMSESERQSLETEIEIELYKSGDETSECPGILCD